MNSQDKNYHLGHVFMDCMQRCPDRICKIDASTGKTETCGSILNRSIRLAKCLRRLGLQPGDVLSLSGKSHLDVHIPYYAALMNGLPILGVDPLSKYDEIFNLLKPAEPRIVFCERTDYDKYIKIDKALNLNLTVISFGDDENSMAKFIEKYDDNTEEEFKPAIFDLDRVFAWLVSTSGSSGMPKVACFKHRQVIERLKSLLPYINNLKNTPNGQCNKMGLTLSSVQVITGFVIAIAYPFYNLTTVQAFCPNLDDLIDIINKHKPNCANFVSSVLSHIMKTKKPCDLSSFDVITTGGSKVYKDVLINIRSRLRKDAYLAELYGQTETLGYIMEPCPNGPINNCGRPLHYYKIKLVDPETEKEITEPYITGEMWILGNTFTGYYNNEEETANCYTKDGWLKTGDLLYRDENDYYFFVDRIKMLIKCRHTHVVPTELEEIINRHEGVYDVGVTAVPDPEDEQHPVAFVVRKPGSKVTAQEIKDLVASKLSMNKKLRGGVVFIDELPMTCTGKLARAKLRQLAMQRYNEKNL